MTAHDLATLIHAISQLHLVRDLPMYTPKLPELCNALATHPSWLAEPDPEDVYLVLASLSLLRWHHKPLLEQAATAVLNNKEARNARIMNKALMCAALLMHSSSTTPKLFSACAQRFASLMRRGELNGRVLVRLAWATAVANQNPDCQVPAGQGKAATKTVVRPFVQLLLEALKDKAQSLAASKPLYGSLAFSLRIWAVTLPSLKVPQELVDLRKQESHSSTVSDTQKGVTRILRSTPSFGLHKVQSEVNVGHGWFVDITATGPAGVKYAFEVDGPQHFAANDSTVQLGNTAIRDHCVGKLGYLVVNVTADMLAGQGIMQTNKSMADKQTLGAIKNAMAVAAGKRQKCTAEATYAVA
ncbi:hypothetical protein HaLaN_24711 [Haematococcus lacustris]|uniref:RAP domain-containing protein n=1 Tax=Haematococcus lacustris TaxID=44745 RepID=A0A699ZV65_HAELA|nr:hypothetical protein HaLaN_24711 [Haematococcus lacustris]